MNQIKDREQRLKKDYNIVKSILNKSGFGWDPVQKVPESIDENGDELSKEQRKWRYKGTKQSLTMMICLEFMAVNQQRGSVVKGQLICSKRRTACLLFYRKKPTQNQFYGPLDLIHLLQQYLLQASMVTNMIGIEFPSAAHSQDVENSSSQFEAEENCTIPGHPPKRYKPSKGSDERRRKTSKESATENLVAFRKEELQTYVDVKLKQIQSYRDVKMAQMQQNNPDNDLYCVTKCIAKVKTVEQLSPRDRLKII